MYSTCSLTSAIFLISLPADGILQRLWVVIFSRARAIQCSRYLRPSPGVPHMITEADQFGDYHIPMGSAVIVNIWFVEFGTLNIPFV